MIIRLNMKCWAPNIYIWYFCLVRTENVWWWRNQGILGVGNRHDHRKPRLKQWVSGSSGRPKNNKGIIKDRGDKVISLGWWPLTRSACLAPSSLKVFNTHARPDDNKKNTTTSTHAPASSPPQHPPVAPVADHIDISFFTKKNAENWRIFS